MKPSSFLIVLAALGGALLSGCSKADDKGGAKTLPGDYAAEPGKGGSTKGATSTP